MDFKIYAFEGSTEWLDILLSIQKEESRFRWNYIETADLRELKKRVDEKGWVTTAVEDI